MTKENSIPKSLVEKICDDLFASIEEREEFNSQTIKQLKQLAIKGDLKKAAKVTQAISLNPEENYEST